MSKLSEQSRWEDDIYQIKNDDDVRGGESGPTNIQARQIANRTQFLKNLFDMLSNVAFTSAELYTSKDAAQDAINKGTEKRQYFNVIRTGDYNVERYENINGIATETGNTLASGAFVEKLSRVVDFLDECISQSDSNASPDWLHGWTDNNRRLVMALDLTGALRLCDMTDAVQDRVRALADYETTVRTPGYHQVWRDSLGKSGAAIQDDWGLVLAGLALPVQDEINALKSGIGSAILRPYNGQLAVFKDAASEKPVYAVNPVSYANRLAVGGASIIYEYDGTMTSGTINLREHPDYTVAPNNWVQRPIPAFVKEVFLRSIKGQSLAVAGGDRVTEVDEYLRGLSLVFFGAGGDRGVGLDGFGEGPVTDEALGVFKDGESIGVFRENSAIPGQQRFLNDLMNYYSFEKRELPAVVSRIDARSGTAYSGLKKGNQVYTDEMTVARTFVSRVIEQGKIPVIHSSFIEHGEKDSEIVTRPGQYKGNLHEWTDDSNKDKLAILSEFGVIQSFLPHTYVGQMGSIDRTEKNRGDLIAYDQLDFCLERPDASMSVNKTILNIAYPLDDVHLIGRGYAILGEYHGQAEAYNYNERLKGSSKKWNIPYITSIVRDGNRLTCTYFSALGLPIQINNRFGTRHDCGYFLENESAKIISVEQSTDNSLTFICDKPPAIGDFLCAGYTSSEFKYPLVTVSDTSTRRSVADHDFIMENFCARQRIAIS